MSAFRRLLPFGRLHIEADEHEGVLLIVAESHLPRRTNG